jgi:hypothetical protein
MGAADMTINVHICTQRKSNSQMHSKKRNEIVAMALATRINEMAEMRNKMNELKIKVQYLKNYVCDSVIHIFAVADDRRRSFVPRDYSRLRTEKRDLPGWLEKSNSRPT